ncbi:MAG: hypothetical protein M3245_06245 [Actinomycetota bacterium]|nr:hypothetical protein [Actinomycetota bacterium]
MDEPVVLDSDMEVTALLCDAAQEVNGKLYILGGGWSVFRGFPVTMALAIKVQVPWVEANKKHTVAVSLRTEDDQLPSLRHPDGTSHQQAMEAQAEIEVGRPAGIRPGTALDAPMAITFGGVPLLPGHYEWRVSINGRLMRRLPFGVLEVQGGAPAG